MAIWNGTLKVMKWTAAVLSVVVVSALVHVTARFMYVSRDVQIYDHPLTWADMFSFRTRRFELIDGTWFHIVALLALIGLVLVGFILLVIVSFIRSSSDVDSLPNLRYDNDFTSQDAGIVFCIILAMFPLICAGTLIYHILMTCAVIYNL